jgi:hypothetical protein
MVAHAYHPSNTGGIGRRAVVQGLGYIVRPCLNKIKTLEY